MTVSGSGTANASISSTLPAAANRSIRSSASWWMRGRSSLIQRAVKARETRPRSRVSSGGHPQGTKELLHVRAGALAVTVGGASFELGPGDALRMRGDRPHTYRNPGAEPTLVTMTVVYSGNRDPRFIPRD